MHNFASSGCLPVDVLRVYVSTSLSYIVNCLGLPTIRTALLSSVILVAVRRTSTRGSTAIAIFIMGHRYRVSGASTIVVNMEIFVDLMLALFADGQLCAREAVPCVL
jgi:hypothetical protein